MLEYKKFVLLGVTGQQPVTPSKIIDMVWHQHVEFTRGYRDFCERVLGTNFDHDPELVPFDAQTDVFSEQYHRTLERYSEEFGTEPPEDIWGTPKFRIQKASRPKAVPAQQSSGSDGGDDLLLWQYFALSPNAGPTEIDPAFHRSISHPSALDYAPAIDNASVGGTGHHGSDHGSHGSHGDHGGGGSDAGSVGGSSCSSGSSCGGGGGCSSA